MQLALPRLGVVENEGYKWCTQETMQEIFLSSEQCPNCLAKEKNHNDLVL